MPSKVNIQVPKEQAAERNRREYVTVLEFNTKYLQKQKCITGCKNRVVLCCACQLPT